MLCRRGADNDDDNRTRAGDCGAAGGHPEFNHNAKIVDGDGTQTESTKTTYRNSNGVVSDSVTRSTTYAPPPPVVSSTTTQSTTTTNTQ